MNEEMKVIVTPIERKINSLLVYPFLQLVFLESFGVNQQFHFLYPMVLVFFSGKIYHHNCQNFNQNLKKKSAKNSSIWPLSFISEFFHPYMMASFKIWMKLLHSLFHWCHLSNKRKSIENNWAILCDGWTESSCKSFIRLLRLSGYSVRWPILCCEWHCSCFREVGDLGRIFKATMWSFPHWVSEFKKKSLYVCTEFLGGRSGAGNPGFSSGELSVSGDFGAQLCRRGLRRLLRFHDHKLRWYMPITCMLFFLLWNCYWVFESSNLWQ